VVALGIIGLVVRHAWLTTKPLSSGDWKWPAAGRINEWFPWPSVWTDTLGFSGENRFLDAFRFPVYAVNGLIGAAGASWTVIEKVVYFIPFAVLLPVAGWLLAREVLGRTRWTILAPALLLANSYFLIEANGEIPLVLSEVLACLALIAFLRTMRSFSPRWALLTGLAVGAACAMDLRPAYLTSLLIVGYVLILTIADPGWRLFGRRVGLAALAAVVFGGTQLFWILPLHFYKGHPAFPTPSAPDFTIITLTHGLTGVSAAWTGGVPAAFVQAPINPLFLILPLLAMIPLAWRRLKPELLWLALAALVCAFLAKTNNPPLGSTYQFLYAHFPGFNLFREGSKFLFPIAIGYAVLIPAAGASIADLVRRSRGHTRQALGVGAAAALSLLVVVSGSTLLTLEGGQLGSTTTPVAMPKAFSDLSHMLDADHQPGSVLWFGGPIYVSGPGGEQKNHSYTITSATHSIDNLSGQATSSVVQNRDVLQYFCATMTDPYCYLTPGLFPYLTRMVGASYVVSPGSNDVGLLPIGVTPGALRDRLTAMFGSPTSVGNPGTQLLVWHVGTPAPSIASYPAVALVDSGPWSLSEVLPALQALGVPAAYRQTYEAADYPPAPANLPGSVTVLPRVDGACAALAPVSAAVMARSTASSLGVRAGTRSESLRLLATPARAPGWGLYGPLSLTARAQPLTATTTGVTLGPCVAWSGVTRAALSSGPGVAGPTRMHANGEQLVASTTGAVRPWVELRRTYDPGWHLQRHKPTAVAEGLFNLYGPVPAAAPHDRLTFTFSTMAWEHRGLALSVLTVIAVIAGIVALARRDRRKPPTERLVDSFDAKVAPWIALGGLAFVVLSGLAALAEWWGLPSRLPRIWFSSNPYNLDIVFAEIAVALLGLSVAVRVVEHVVQRRRQARQAATAAYAAATRRAAGVAVGMTAMALFVAGCGITGGGANRALNNAQQAGATSPDIEGATLLQARVLRTAKDAGKCVSEYTVALRTYRTLVDAYVGRGVCYLSAGLDDGAAVHDFTRALALSPGNPEVLLDRAAADQGIGNVGAAARDFQATANAPSATDLDVLNAIDGLAGIGELQDAQNTLRLGQARFPGDPLVLSGASDLALAVGNDAQAEQYLTDAQKSAASSTDAYVRATVQSRTCGFQVIHYQYLSAVKSCHQAAVVSSDGSGAFDNLSAAEAQLGYVTQAISAMTSAIGAFQGNVSPTAQPAGVDGFGLAFLLEERGRLYVEADKPALAVADYRAAKDALPPGNPDFAARLRGDIRSATVA
jgi:tetratricopeptide (TPR) repeat protein